MEKTKLQAIAVVILFSIGAVLWIFPYFSKRKTESDIKESDIKVKGYEVIKIEEPNFSKDFFETQKQMEEKRPKLIWTRDPFSLLPKEPLKPKSVLDELVLSGIAVDEKGRIAIINGEIVREGDTILGLKVLEIKENSVVVEKEGKSYNIEL